ncbi:MAG: DNA polymerase III subunit gamma/tau [Acidimicrobiales bacterium]
MAEPVPPADEVFQSLYRRYRPQRFGELRGQAHVSDTLRNAVRDSRVAHAYLFSGPRGTGKTSTARILAMALNCEIPVDGEPDGSCASCVEIRRGASLDVQELDAASNRGIDDMRDLLARVSLATPGRWKVYIIDEVHQLSSPAATALLKTLEEQPAHVVFVLATTDPQKVLPTIRSRTQHFEFRLLNPEVLAELLNDVNRRAALGVPPEAIDLVVRRGHGSARDALSVLDQVAAAGTVEDEATILAEVVDALADRDAGRALVALAEAMSAGRDPRRLAADLLAHLRNGFLATQARALVLLPDAAVAEVDAQARRLGAAAVVRAMEVIGQAAIDMRDSVDPRITLEVALVRLASPAADDSPAALLARIERLERSAGETVKPGEAPAAGSPTLPRMSSNRPPSGGPGRSASAVVPPPPPPPPGVASGPPGRPALGAHRRPPTAGAPRRADPPRPSEAAAIPAAAPPAEGGTADLPTRDELTTAWGDSVLPALRTGAKAYLSAGRFINVEGGAAVFALPDAGLLQRAESVKAETEAALGAHFGRPVHLRLVQDSALPPAKGAGAAEAEEDPSAYDLSELEDAGPAVTSPEQRLLEAFPGAEEVTP